MEVTGGFCLLRSSEANDYRLRSGDALADHINRILHPRAAEAAYDGLLDWVWNGQALRGCHWWLQKGERVIDLTAGQFRWGPILDQPLDERHRVDGSTCGVREVSRFRGAVAVWKRDWPGFEAAMPAAEAPDEGHAREDMAGPA